MRARSSSGKFIKKENDSNEQHIEEIEINGIKHIEYSDLWIFKAIDALAKTILGILIRLGIQIFFVLLFAVLLKKIGMLEIFKEIFSILVELFSYAKGVSGTKEDSVNGNTGNSGKSYFN